jgi:Arc/MetJ family transcription regulator
MEVAMSIMDEIDADVLMNAQAALGTSTPLETVMEALRRVVRESGREAALTRVKAQMAEVGEESVAGRGAPWQ